MAGLNQQVDVEGEEMDDVVKKYLVEQGLI